MRKLLIFSFFAIILAGCGAKPALPAMGPEIGMGPGGMASRHHAQVPAEYSGLQSPQADADKLQRGIEIYSTSCVSCHGEQGLGDGPTAASLDPAPAPVSHTSQMMGDSYLFWRISEGGTSFGTSMPAWKGTLSEADIWSVVAYMRSMDSADFSAIQAAQHEEMLSQAIDRSLITQNEADTFTLVHDALDAYRSDHQSELPASSADEVQDYMLNKLVESGTITQSQANDFARIHQLLLDEGLMQ